ncbi:unnamed protein product [Brassica oleracea var. botrytis]|uniref:Uncharacterized protein n=1 Tax=Brassica oleracea TaxID=3712 RepID=A0A3P6EVU9_BRAOL|nr:unnamed protein product [Brassica oleracea]
MTVAAYPDEAVFVNSPISGLMMLVICWIMRFTRG